MSEWVSVKDGLPAPMVRVLCLSYKWCRRGHHHGYAPVTWLDDHLNEIDKVTHWLPLPDAPSYSEK